MKAFVQVQEDGEFYSENQFSAWRAFSHFGYDVVKLKRSEIHRFDITPETPCCAGLETMRQIFRQMKVAHTELDSYPTSIDSRFFGRIIGVLKVKDLVQRLKKEKKLFIKPTDKHRKMFNGRVFKESDIDNDVELASLLRDHPQMEVYFSEVTEFSSEYRVFILKDTILDARPYKGDPSLGFDKSLVEACMAEFWGKPKAYCLDVGKRKIDRRTTLVEVTDAYSFGHYGLNCDLYGQMLIERWNEITCNKSHGQHG